MGDDHGTAAGDKRVETIRQRLIDPKIFREDNESVTLLPFRAAFHDIELHAAFGEQFYPPVIHLVARHAEVAAAGEERGLRDRDGLIEKWLELLQLSVDFANDVVNGGIQLAIWMDLISDIATRALRHVLGQLGVQLRRMLEPAEVRPKVFETNGQAVDRHAEPARVTDHRAKIVIAVMLSVREERFMIGVID
jgi:hypothetical protein